MNKNFFKAVLLAIAMVPASLIAQDWQTVFTFNPSQTLHSIRFANDMVGYTVSTLYNGSTYNIHKTVDGGQTWTDQSSGYEATRFKDIFIVSEDTVWMCGNNGLVLHTFDGGENWFSDTIADCGHLAGIWFIGETGYVCGDAATVFRTPDMGQSWEKLSIPGVSTLADIFFFDENKGYVCGMNLILITQDGGDTWTEPVFFPGATVNWYLREFSFIDKNKGFVCGDIGQIYKTTDGGLNWKFLDNTGTSESLQSMVALDANFIYACGFAGTVICSSDGGETWSPMTSSSSQNLYSMDMTPDGNGHACSQTGEILQYDNPSTGTDDATSEQYRVFPNPAKDLVHIACDRFTRAEVYNMQGKRVQEAFTTTIDISRLEPGIYLLKVLCDDGKAITQRLLKD